MKEQLGFSIVRFSPDPEEIERVNVALLLWGAERSLFYRDDFPKLRCVAGDAFPRSFLREYLESLAQRARALPPEESYVALNAVSAQVRVSRFRHAPQVADPAFVAGLAERYLDAHDPKRTRERRPSIESQLDDVLRTVLARGSIHRRPSPADLFGADPAFVSVFGGGAPVHVARALSGARGHLLVDGLDLTAPAKDIEERTGRLSYAFHRFGQARSILHARGQELHRLAVFLGDVTPKSEHEAVRAWAREKLRTDADVVDAADAAARIRREAERVGALLPSN